MATLITLDNTTLVNGLTSTGQFLIANSNNTQIGIPIYTFSYSTPDIDIVGLTVQYSIDLTDATIAPEATGYGAGIAVSINTSGRAIPIYKIEQDDSVFPKIEIQNPKIVSQMESTGEFMVLKVNGELYGIPLYTYTTEYPFTSTVSQSSINITTSILQDLVLDVTTNSGSTYLAPKIRAYSDLIDRVKSMLGYPTISVDVCDEDIVKMIDQAMELYTKYTGYTEEFLIFDVSRYNPNCGIKMDAIFSYNPELNTTCNPFGSGGWDYDLRDYRKVMDVFSFEQGQGTGINTLFTIEQVVANQVYFGNLLGSNGFDLVTFDVLKGWLDTREKVLAQRVHYRFDPKKQVLRLLPIPNTGESYTACIGCYVQRTIGELINEPWIIYYTLALTKIMVGTIRSKYSFTMFGGATLRGDEILSRGLQEKEELEKQLYTYTGLVENEPPMPLLA